MRKNFIEEYLHRELRRNVDAGRHAQCLNFEEKCFRLLQSSFRKHYQVSRMADFATDATTVWFEKFPLLVYFFSQTLFLKKNFLLTR